VAATVVYRAVTCWAMAAVGSVMLLIIGHGEPVSAEQTNNGNVLRSQPFVRVIDERQT
jgi:hypothetical protein